MIITIIILAYVANVFLTRWLNKIDYKYYNADPTPFLWFIPLAGTLVILISLISEVKTNNWFTGKNW